jgi:quinol monooxygenase YgiN
MQDIVYVVAKLQARAGKEETLRRIIEQGIESTRKEKGCLRYSLMQDMQNPLVLTLLEEWETEVDLDTHLALPHLQKIFAQLPEMLSAPMDIARYKKLA